MAGLESRYWSQVVRPLFVEAGLRADRITERVRPGEPDVRVLDGRTGRVALVELKAPPGDPLRGKLGLRPAQAAFLRGWAEAGGLGGVLVGWWSRGHWVHAYWQAQASVAWVRMIQGSQPYAEADHLWYPAVVQEARVNAPAFRLDLTPALLRHAIFGFS